MTASEEAKLNMLVAVDTFCNDPKNATAVGSVTVLSSLLTKLTDNIRLIRENLVVQLKKGAGGTTKSQLRVVLNDSTFTISQGVYAYAIAVNNGDLATDTRYTISDVKRIRDEDIIEVAEGIYNLAKANEAALAPYGLSSGEIDSLLTDINEYRTSLSNPRMIRVDKKTAGANIKDYLKDSDNLLKKQIDPIVNGMKKAFPDFFKGYYTSRKLLDPATRSTTIEGIVVDAKNDNTPILRAKLTLGYIDKNGDNITVFTETDQNGAYKFPAKARTIYSLKAEAVQFITQERNGIVVKQGQILKQDFGLMPS